VCAISCRRIPCLIAAVTQLLEADRKQLETLRERNDNLEREVQRFRERKELEKQVRGATSTVSATPLPDVV